MGRLTVLKQIAADIASQFGPDCEVVIHDLKTSARFLMRSVIRRKEKPRKTIPVI